MVLTGRAKGAGRYVATAGIAVWLCAFSALAAQEGGPPISPQKAPPAQNPRHDDGPADPQPGSSASRRLYVAAQCDHGCGYAEDDKGWREKFWTDPTATFTGALAILTLALVVVGTVQSTLILRAEKLTRKALKSSRRQAKAARKAANAAIAIELPILRALAPDDLLDVANIPPEFGPFAGTVNDGIPGRFSVVDAVKFNNGGRTHAYPVKVALGWSIAPELPPEPAYRRTIESAPGAAFPPEVSTTLTTVPVCIEASEGEIAAMAAGEASLWFYGKLDYLDFLDRPHSHRFCWKWDRPDGVGMYWFTKARDAPATYTQKT